ncbi:MAG: MarR family winged helix-turn-helix transcriptional regulator [Planctomycetota bacterium]
MNDLKGYRSLFLSQVQAAYRVMSRSVENAVGEVDSPDGHLLSYVLRYGPCTVGRLRDVFGIKGATLTGQLDRLEKRGLLKRGLNPEDRRSFLVGVTPKGRRLVRRTGEHVKEIESVVRGQVSDRDYAAFLRVIEVIRKLEASTQPTE